MISNSSEKPIVDKGMFIDAQCQQIMNMIQAGMMKSGGTSTWFSTTGLSHLAGNVTNSFHSVSPIQQCNHSNTTQWLINSGATDHITPFVHILSNVKPINTVLHLPNGHTVAITHIGDLTLCSNITC